MSQCPIRGNERSVLSDNRSCSERKHEIMSQKAIFDHAGCGLCVDAEQWLADVKGSA
jgi:hypothetical protein